MNHTIYVSKRSVLGQGISFQDLNLLLETIEDVEIVEWNAHQGNWVKEIPSLVRTVFQLSSFHLFGP